MYLPDPQVEKRKQREAQTRRLQENARRKLLEAECKSAKEREQRQADELRKQKIEQAERERIEKAAHDLWLTNTALHEDEASIIRKHTVNLCTFGVFCLKKLVQVDRPLAVCSFKNLHTAVNSKKVSTPVAFISDESGYIHAFDTAGNSLLRFGGPGILPTQFTCAISLIASKWNHLIICDQGNARISIFDATKLLRAALMALYQGNAEVDTITLPRYKVSGALLVTFGTPGSGQEQFSSPRGVALDESSGRLYISDQLNHRIQVYSLYSDISCEDGVPSMKKPVLVLSMGARGTGFGQLFRPFGIAVTHYHVVVCDTGNCRIALFKKSGKHVVNYGNRGSGQNEFKQPTAVITTDIKKSIFRKPGGMANIDEEQFTMYVADEYNYRIQSITENGEFKGQLSDLNDPNRIMEYHDRVQSLKAELLSIVKGLPHNVNIGTLPSTVHPSSAMYSKILNVRSRIDKLCAQAHQPRYIAIDSQFNLLVCDREKNAIFLFNPRGVQYRWICTNIGIGCFGGISFHPASNSLIVADVSHHRLSVIHLSNPSEIQNSLGAATYGDVEGVAGGFLPNELYEPTAVCFQPCHPKSGNSYVVIADTGNHRVQVLDFETGEFLLTVGGLGQSDGYFQCPTSVDVLREKIYVCDQQNHRIQVIDLKTGNHCYTFGAGGSTENQLSFPTGIAVCDDLPHPPENWSFGNHRMAKIAVADTGNHRVVVFDILGAPMQIIGCFGNVLDGIRFNSPEKVLIHQRTGYIIVCDTGNACIQIISNTGEFIHRFGINLVDHLLRPVSVALSESEPMKIWVADTLRLGICEFTAATVI